MLVHFFCTVVFADNDLATITTDYGTFRRAAYTGTIREAVMAKIANATLKGKTGTCKFEIHPADTSFNAGIVAR